MAIVDAGDSDILNEWSYLNLIIPFYCCISKGKDGLEGFWDKMDF
jgi:hypothetical protein